ncbi:MAG: DUF2927 domain-containing protein [Defluviimonas sp.]|uniref:DUF2927 domain-containing protein n=1 Tax=Albidovulum sp. TaxID=1872424 RepID=UPI001DAC89BF|nr:DUF2927 domain-containing protein [Paracoccaceae bacterium]MCC0063804.1 DUF2927 domain-containing protein [Defluviimonas sp.]
MLSRLRLAPLAALATAAALAACDTATLTRPVALPPVPAAAAIAPPSEATRAARAYYERVEARYLEQGQMRTDGGGTDTPFDARDLARNFENIAFYEEYSETSGTYVSGPREIALHRWVAPVRMDIRFGATIPLADRESDYAEIAGFAGRLSRLTGLPIRLSDWRPNHTVLILNPEERAAAAPLLRTLAPGISEAALRSVTAMDPETYCTVFTFAADGSSTYSSALTVIRGELPFRMRQLCIHEELAQSLGLGNDDPRARPSIFNDNEEFALLTTQDELMLKMLYDPRLRPGMTLAEARPIVEVIAAELAGDRR